MKLYDNTAAPNPRRVRVFLAEKGLEIDTVQVDMLKGAFGIDEKRYLDTAGGKWNLRNIAGQLLAS